MRLSLCPIEKYIEYGCKHRIGNISNTNSNNNDNNTNLFEILYRKC